MDHGQQPLERAEVEDLFPLLDSLVREDLNNFGVIHEACRLIYQHTEAFLQPTLFLTLSIALSAPFNDIPSSLSWVSYISSLVLSSFAEVGLTFHQAVVRVYLEERFGRRHASRQSRNDLFLCAMRCTGSTLAARVLTALCVWMITLTPAGARYAGDSRPLHPDYVINTAGTAYHPDFLILALLSGAVAMNFTTFLINCHFLVLLPASALTTVWGFRALDRSFMLHRPVANELSAREMVY